VTGLTRTRVPYSQAGEEKSRDRVLSREELRELWTALHQTGAEDAEGKPLPRLSKTLNDAFIVMLLTAQRSGEVCRMRWQDVDIESGWWTIPAEASKNHDPHRVPLTAWVLELLKRRKVGGDNNRYVFSNHRHTAVSARAKKAASTLSRGLSFEFRAHDLRRTASSFMGEAGADRFHIAYVLNHRSVTHNTVTAIYDRYRYDKEKRAALDKWAVFLREAAEFSSTHQRRQPRDFAITRQKAPGSTVDPGTRHSRGRIIGTAFVTGGNREPNDSTSIS
jgi:integrase